MLTVNVMFLLLFGGKDKFVNKSFKIFDNFPCKTLHHLRVFHFTANKNLLFGFKTCYK